MNKHIIPPAPRILQYRTNLTTAKPGNYLELAFTPTKPGTHLVQEIMNATGIPTFAGGNGASWHPHLLPGTMSVFGISNRLGASGTTAGATFPVPGMHLGFVAEIADLTTLTVDAVAPLMTEVKKHAIASHGEWLDTTLTQSAQYVYRHRNARDFDDDLDAVMRKLGHLPEDAIHEMVYGGLGDFIRSLLNRRPVIEFERSVDHVLLDEVDRARAAKRPTLGFVDFAEAEEEDEVAAVDTEARRLAIVPGDENDVVDRETLRWFCDQLRDLDRQIVCHLFKDRKLTTTALAKRCGTSRETIRLHRKAIAEAAMAAGLHRLMRA